MATLEMDSLLLFSSSAEVKIESEPSSAVAAAFVNKKRLVVVEEDGIVDDNTLLVLVVVDREKPLEGRHKLPIATSRRTIISHRLGANDDDRLFSLMQSIFDVFR